MPSAVVTVVAGRHDHLRRQRQSLAAGSVCPDLHVVVAMGDPGVAVALDDGSGLTTTLIELEVTDGRLPLAAARNAGFAEAIAQGAGTVIGLDVDCLADVGLISGYAAAAESPEGSGSLLCGAVTYLAPGADVDGGPASLAALRRPHPARPAPAAGTAVPGDHLLFWSLSFALTAATWDRIGGFDEKYAGYGAEDTDFGQRAKAALVPLLWLGGADAYHQYHPTATPPVQHTDDLLRNGAIFADRWGWWPMRGWFEELAANGMVKVAGTGWAPADPVRLLTIPGDHPYVSAVQPQHVAPVAPQRAPGWSPDPALEVPGLQELADQCDAVHVHFGYDHLTQAGMAQWTKAVRAAGLPLIVTVHDLRNPHHRDPARHDAHLALLMGTADEVITLTPGAAAELESRFGVRATVIPHPTLLQRPPSAHLPTEAGLVAVHLKSLRTNVLEPERVVRAVLAGARQQGGRLRVDLHPEAMEHPDLGFLRQLASESEIELNAHERFDDPALEAYLAQAQVSVLPYRFGTHSGWLELCRDLGTRVVAPDCGFYDQQWDEVISYPGNERTGLDEVGLTAAVARALVSPAPAPADWGQRRLDRELIRMHHARVYAAAIAR